MVETEEESSSPQHGRPSESGCVPSSRLTDGANNMSSDRLPPIHPGEVLFEDFLVAMGLSQYRLAKDISVPPRRINEIVHGKRGISTDTALRLARYFGTSELFWLNLQTHYELEIERDRLGARLDDEVQPLEQTG